MQNLSAARAIGANPVQIDTFFDQLKQWVRKFGTEYKLNHIWNVGKSGITDVPKPQKVIGVVKECAFQIVTDKKGTNTTLLTFVSAGGLHVPPMIIFKAGRVKDIWREAAPLGYHVQVSESGYINAALFADYGEKFVKFLRESNLMTPGVKHLILLDLHKSHLFNVNFMQYMKAKNIEVCSFPPHCTHILQPLDDMPYGIMKAKYQKELINFNFDVAGKKINENAVLSRLSACLHKCIHTSNYQKRLGEHWNIPNKSRSPQTKGNWTQCHHRETGEF